MEAEAGRWGSGLMAAMPLACHSITMLCFYGARASSTNFSRVLIFFISLFFFFLSSYLLWRYFSCPFRFLKSSTYVQQVLSENCPFCRCILDVCICEKRQTTHPPILLSWLLPSSMILNMFVWLWHFKALFSLAFFKHVNISSYLIRS